MIITRILNKVNESNETKDFFIEEIENKSFESNERFFEVLRCGQRYR